MPPAKPTSQPRRPILRFELQDVRFNGRASLYKDPQLVLKPQLDLIPSKPTNGSRLRMPVWRHYLMIHVKDRAEELVKLDLADFQQSEEQVNAEPERSIHCAHHEPILYVRYPTSTQDGFTILQVTLKVASDFESVLKELGDLGITIGSYQQEAAPYQTHQDPFWGQSHGQPPNSYYYHHPSPSPMPGPLQMGMLPYSYSPSPPCPDTPTPSYQAIPSSAYPATPYSSYGVAPNPLYSATPSHFYAAAPSPPYPATPTPPYQYPNPAGLPNQGQIGGYHSQGHWSSPMGPSPAGTATGIPGMLGPGIYKVTKLASSSTSRSKTRKGKISRSLLESGRFDRGKYSGDSPSTIQALSSRTSSQNSSLGPSQVDPDSRRGLQRSQSVYTESQETTSQASTLVTDDYDPSTRAFGGLRIPEEEETRDEFSQQTAIATTVSRQPNKVAIVTPSQFNSSTEMVPCRTPQQNNKALSPKKISPRALLQLSKIQHEGLIDATRLWNEMMGKARRAINGVNDGDEAFYVLCQFKEEFKKRWDRVVASTLREMKEVEDIGRM
ncbi:hypothetical protein QBC40DRAFT_325155 [Triangularia verruculosa]|uniref:Uncharacterized protein n=1 Tax=Triangularia verruculosa TaxID=2587418 RepID=A0AAN6XI61_9PEZI|nr:hypothetical protein QBC40DRAFT_325155 [Triangularia verruculosa]